MDADDRFQVYTLPEFPDYEARAGHLASQWADFVYHEVDSKDYYPTMVQAYKDLHFFLCDENDEVVAHAQAMGIRWDGTKDNLPLGWSDAIMRCAKNSLEGDTVNTLCGVSVTVAPNRTGEGIGRKTIETMKQLGIEAGYERMIVPVRPSEKSRYPLIKMQDYVTWQNDDGYFFDKWLRIHQRAGAKMLGIAAHSMRVLGTVNEWETWTGRHFPATGMYIVDGALNPIIIDHENDLGTYIEANVWMEHPMP
ncbi:MAG: GNAT family N-acetyltransferase [Chloroflexota bacterium]